MNSPGIRLIALITVIWFGAAPVEGQTERPTIGLALSGGGARGLAHIGVLRWFEENRIPIDYIAGTSMGGLVGGMYAMGMSAPELAQLVETTDWNAVLRGAPPYPEASFRRKQDRSTFASGVTLGLRDGEFRIPRGLNAGHTIGLIFNRAALAYETVDSFDDLPIPFRSLGTELGEGRLVVFSDGSVSAALRATMSIPGVFTPVVDGDRIYADGGLLNNMPTDVVRAMGADIVIAVDIGTPLLDPDELDDLFGILSQSLTVTRIQNDRRNLELADIVLAPDLGDYTLMDFGDFAPLMELGYSETVLRSEDLTPLSLDPDAWQEHLNNRLRRARTVTPVPREIIVNGVSGSIADSIRQQVAAHIDRPLVPVELERDLTRAVGSGRFARLGYRIPAAGSLAIDALENDYGPPFVSLSLNLDTATGDPVELAVGARFTVMDVGPTSSEWRTDLQVGTVDQTATELYVPIGPSRWFVAPRAWWQRSQEDLFDGNDRVAQFGSRTGGVGVDMGYAINRFSEIRAGFELLHIATAIHTGDPVFTDTEGGVHSAFIRWTYDGHDQPVIPTRGIRVDSETRWFSEHPGLTADLIQSEISISALLPLSRRGSGFLKASGGRDFRHEARLVQQFSLGGFSRLSAWDRGGFRSGRYALAVAGYLHDLAAMPAVLGDRLYVTAFAEAGRMFGDSMTDELLFDGALALGTRSPLGAVWFGGAIGEGGRTQVFLRLGRFF
jgi:NTE family protein